MANIPKKMQDPADNALTAIQEVLNSADNPAEARSGTPSDAPQVPSDTVPPRARGLTPPPETDLFDEPAEVRDQELRLPRPPANDDRQSIGQILHDLQRRPSNVSYVVASAFAVAWVDRVNRRHAGCSAQLQPRSR